MKHVLVIDDDAAIRGMLVDFLSEHAFRVTGISDSRPLSNILAKDPVDLMSSI